MCIPQQHASLMDLQHSADNSGTGTAGCGRPLNPADYLHAIAAEDCDVELELVVAGHGEREAQDSGLPEEQTACMSGVTLCPAASLVLKMASVSFRCGLGCVTGWPDVSLSYRN